MKSAITRGFTLVEMVVVVGIIALISGLMLANNNRYGGVVILQNLAYDISLSIRQAQVYGIAVQRFNSTFNSSYGMHFQLGSGDSGSTYVLFADALSPENGLYDCPQPGTSNCELVQSSSIALGYSIAQLCMTPAAGVENCSLTSLDIVFKRPEPDAYIRSRDTVSVGESARIIVRSPRGDTKSVSVQTNGQISVE